MNFLLNKLKNQRRKAYMLNIVIKYHLKQLIQNTHILVSQAIFKLFDSIIQYLIAICFFTKTDQ